MYRVFWKSLLTGSHGHGKPVSKDIAESKVYYGNRKFKNLVHWYEPVKLKLVKGASKQNRVF